MDKTDKLQGLIDALSSARAEDPVEPNSHFSDLDDEGLAEMQAQAAEAFTALQGQRLTEDVVSQMETIAEASAAIATEVTRRAEAATELANRAAGLAEKILPKQAEGAAKDADGGKGDAKGGDGAPEAKAGVVEVVVSDEAIQQVMEGELVTASATTRPRSRVDLSALQRNQPAKTAATMPEDNGLPTIRVTADLPGFPGDKIIASMDDMVQAVRNRFASFPIGTAGVQVRGGIVDVHRQFPSDLVAGGNRKQDMDVIEYAADETRLPGGSLLAAANTGWCVPHEIDRTLCSPLETLDGLLQTPTVAVRPPGVTYPGIIPWWQMFDFSTLKDFCPPELCGVAKPCVSVPCPDWLTGDVCVEPFCVESCILAEKSFPQWTNQFVSRAIIAFRRWQNLQVITKILAKIDAAHKINGLTSLGASHSVFDSLALLIAWYKDLYRMGRNATLDVVAPMWLLEVLRADMSKRSGLGGDDITDAQIRNWFANRGANVQFIYDWQSLAGKTDGSAPDTKIPTGSPKPPTKWPESVQILVYPAGTFVSGKAEIFRMDGMYDAASLKLNKYTKIFFEDAVMVLQRCYEAFLITIPTCVRGAEGPRIDLCPPPPTP